MGENPFKLDNEVAEKVMGWRFAGDDDPYRIYKIDGGCITSRGPEKFGIGEIPDPWRPTQDVDAMWDVIEWVKLQPKYVQARFTTALERIIGNRTWEEQRRRPIGLFALLDLQSKDVCLAALGAIGEEAADN